MLSPLFRAEIEDFYGLTLTGVTAGPRGLTGAETYILTDHQGRRFFAKHVIDPVMQTRLKQGLVIANALADYGLSFVVAPVKGDLGSFLQTPIAVLALFPMIDAASSRDYDPGLLGAALGAVHSATPFLDLGLPARGHTSAYDDFFRHGIAEFVQQPVQDETPRGVLRNLIVENETRLRRYRDVFYDLGLQPVPQAVVTHGDMQGNILQGPDGAMHLIDWDEAELGPAERDLWFLSSLPGFMEGYCAVRRGFKPDPRELLHGALKAWLEGLAIQASAIIDNRGDTRACLQNIIERRFSAERLERIDAAIARFDP